MILVKPLHLLLPEAVITEASYPLHHYLEQLTMIDKEPEAVRKEFILSSWNSMTQAERFVFNKLITGSFRIGVSQKMMVNALSRTVSLPSSVIAHRISGNWNPMSTTIEDLLSENAVNADHSKPYPFYLAYALEEDPQHWASRQTGRLNGNGMEYAARSSNAIMNCLSGAVAKN